MNIPLQLKCPECGEPWMQVLHLNEPSAAHTCKKCGTASHGIPGLDVTVGVLILARSWHELKAEKDYDMSIVLAATALDCELSFLYCKWKGIEALRWNTAYDQETCDEELRRLGNAAEKIENVSGILYSGGMEKFVNDSTSWNDTLNRFPSLHAGSLPRDFQQTVFWPRNKVLHRGECNHTEEDASRCYSIAGLGIEILKDMDKAKLHFSRRSLT